MCFYTYFSFGYLIFLVLVACVSNMKQHKNNKKQINNELKIFKNITEANETLQKLIKNYKHLENIYKSDETTVDSDFIGSESDEAFRQISYEKQTFTTNDPTTYYRGTAYIYEKQENSELGSEDLKDEREELVNIKGETTAEKASLENNAKTKTSSEKIPNSDEIEPKSESEDIVEITMNSPKDIENIMSESKTSFNKKRPQNYPNNPFQKTRFSVLQSGKDKINDRINKSKIPFKVGNQRIVYSEQFSPETIWHEIINRPIKLNRVIVTKGLSKSSNRDNEKNADIILTDNKKKEDSTKKKYKPKNQQKLSNIASDGHYILRNDYGAACSLAPIKNCKKAMKAVNKNVCKIRFKCKSDFRSDFVEKSKKECVKKFSYTYSVSNESKYLMSSEKKDDNQFLDASRFKHLQKSISNKKPSLRDKYEKRCQKESRDKCIAACNDAKDETCLKHTCDIKKKKALGKACKKECKYIFVIDMSSESSYEDNSDNESD